MADDNRVEDVCFIVGVIGKSDSEQRIHADWLFSGIVEPVFSEHFRTFKVVRADMMNTPGIITSQIIEHLLGARLVIADLTFLNPNVFYEIGIRHMTNKPIVHVHQAGENIPFDISTFLSMDYSRQRHADLLVAQNKLKVLVDNVLHPDHQMETPVTQARGRAEFAATASTPDRVLLSSIEALTARISVLEQETTPLGLLNNRQFLGKEYPRPLPPSAIRGGIASRAPERLRFHKGKADNATLEYFIAERVMAYGGQTLEVKKIGEAEWEVQYPVGALTHGVLKGWLETAESLGLDVSA